VLPGYRSCGDTTNPHPAPRTPAPHGVGVASVGESQSDGGNQCAAVEVIHGILTKADVGERGEGLMSNNGMDGNGSGRQLSGAQAPFRGEVGMSLCAPIMGVHRRG
jgi:hypothetical protein